MAIVLIILTILLLIYWYNKLHNQSLFNSSKKNSSKTQTIPDNSNNDEQLLNEILEELKSIENGPFSDSFDLFTEDARYIGSLLLEKPVYDETHFLHHKEKLIHDFAQKIAMTWKKCDGDVIPDPERVDAYANLMEANEAEDYRKLALADARSVVRGLKLALISDLQRELAATNKSKV